MPNPAYTDTQNEFTERQVGPFFDNGAAVLNLLALGSISTTDNAALFDDALDALSGSPPHRVPLHVPYGTYKIIAATNEYDFGNLGVPLYFAVKLAGHDLTIEGSGTIQVWGRTGAVTSPPEDADIQVGFATDVNETVGAIRNLTLRDFALEASAVGSPGYNRRGFYLVGVRGLRLLDLVVKNSVGPSGRNLYLAHIQNCHDVQVRGLRLHDTQAGINFRYVRGVDLTDIQYDNFSEAFDFDGVNWDVTASNLQFRNGGPGNQCLDLNSLVRGVFSGIIARDVGNLVTVNFKYATPETFPEYLDGTRPVNLTPSRDIVVRGVRGENVGSATNPCVTIGNDWAGLPHPGTPPVSDIRLVDWVLRNAGYVNIREGSDLLLQDLHFVNVTSPETRYAIDARSQYGELEVVDFDEVPSTVDTTPWSDLGITVRDVAIDGSDRGGLYITAASRVDVDGLRTRGIDTAGTGDADLRVNAMHIRGAQVTIDRLNLGGRALLNGDSTAAGALPYTVVWGGRNRIGMTPMTVEVGSGGAASGATSIPVLALPRRLANGDVLDFGGGRLARLTAAAAAGSTTLPVAALSAALVQGDVATWRAALLLSGDVHNYIKGRSVTVDLGDIPATGTVDRVLFRASRRCRIARASYTTLNAVPASSTNYRNLAFRRSRAGASLTISAPNAQAGTTAFIPVSAGFGSIPTNNAADLEIGDLFVISLTSAGTGAAMTGLTIDFELLEY